MGQMIVPLCTAPFPNGSGRKFLFSGRVVPGDPLRLSHVREWLVVSSASLTIFTFLLFVTVRTNSKLLGSLNQQYPEFYVIEFLNSFLCYEQLLLYCYMVLCNYFLG